MKRWKGKAVFVGPRYAEGTVKYETRMAQASKLVKSQVARELMISGRTAISVEFDAFHDGGLRIEYWRNFHEAEEFYLKNTNLAAAIFTP